MGRYKLVALSSSYLEYIKNYRPEFQSDIQQAIKSNLNSIIELPIVESFSRSKPQTIITKEIPGRNNGITYVMGQVSSSVPLTVTFARVRPEDDPPERALKKLMKMKESGVPVVLITPFEFESEYYIIEDISENYREPNEMNVTIKLKEFAQVQVKQTQIQLVNYMQSEMAQKVYDYLQQMEVV